MENKTLEKGSQSPCGELSEGGLYQGSGSSGSSSSGALERAELKYLLEELASAFGPGAKPDREDGWDRVFGAHDAGILLDAGWEYGYSRDTIWGKDNTDVDWVLWTPQEYGVDAPGQGGTIWYKVDGDGKRERVGTRRYSIVRNSLNGL